MIKNNRINFDDMHGFSISTVLIGFALVLAVIAFIFIPVAALKIPITRAVEIKYRYSNADIILVQLLSYDDINKNVILYTSGMLTQDEEKTFEEHTQDILDDLVISGCYRFYYEDGETKKMIIDKTGNQINSMECSPEYLAKTVIISPYGENMHKLALEIG